MRTTINVERPEGVSLSVFFHLVRQAFNQEPTQVELQDGTWVLGFDQPHPAGAGYWLAAMLGEDCVAQKHTPDPTTVMSLLGPRAHAWEPFDPGKFKEPAWQK